MRPASTMMIATDAAKIGRSMKKFTMGLSGPRKMMLGGERVRIAPSVSVLIGGGCSSHADRLRSVRPELDPAGGLAHQCSQLGRIDGISEHEGLDQRVRQGIGQAQLSAGTQHRKLPFERGWTSQVRHLYDVTDR
jgi:hypothetical protein